LLATAGDAVRVWDLGTGKELPCSPLGPADSPPARCELAIARDGRALVALLLSGRATSGEGSAGDRVRTWDLGTGKLDHEWSLDRSHSYVMLSPDAKTIVQNDGGAGFRVRDA